MARISNPMSQASPWAQGISNLGMALFGDPVAKSQLETAAQNREAQALQMEAMRQEMEQKKADRERREQFRSRVVGGDQSAGLLDAVTGGADLQQRPAARTAPPADDVAMAAQALQEQDAAPATADATLPLVAAAPVFDPGRRLPALDTTAGGSGGGGMNHLNRLGAEHQSTASGSTDLANIDPLPPGGYRQKVAHRESRDNATARSKVGTASGRYGFINGTWHALGGSGSAADADPAEQDRRFDDFTRTNAGIIADDLGREPVDWEVYAAHHFGPGKAERFLRAADDERMENVLPASWIKVNPHLAGKTVGEVKRQFAQEFGSGKSWKGGDEPAMVGGYAGGGTTAAMTPLRTAAATQTARPYGNTFDVEALSSPSAAQIAAAQGPDGIPAGYDYLSPDAQAELLGPAPPVPTSASRATGPGAQEPSAEPVPSSMLRVQAPRQPTPPGPDDIGLAAADLAGTATAPDEGVPAAASAQGPSPQQVATHDPETFIDSLDQFDKQRLRTADDPEAEYMKIMGEHQQRWYKQQEDAAKQQTEAEGPAKSENERYLQTIQHGMNAGRTDTLEYALAYNQLYEQPHYQMVTEIVDGKEVPTMKAVMPRVPAGVKPPTYGVDVAATQQQQPMPATAGQEAVQREQQAAAATQQQPGQQVQSTPLSAGQDVKLTADQSNAVNFVNRMDQAAVDMDGAAQRGADLTGIIGSTLVANGTGQDTNFLGRTLMNLGLNDAQKSYLQAARVYINAALRRESGAAISGTEWQQALDTYLPALADSADLQAQKKRTRENTTQGIYMTAGPGRAQIDQLRKDRQAQQPAGTTQQQQAAPTSPNPAEPGGANNPIDVPDLNAAMKYPSGTYVRLPDGTTKRKK